MRLIDADALDFGFDRRVFGEDDENYIRGADDAIGVVMAAPTIDPVCAAGGCYCRERRRCDGFPGPGVEQNEVGVCHIDMTTVPPDGWCKWGMLREARDDD